MLDLVISFLSVNLFHSYLLVSQKNDRKETISAHAASTKLSHYLYIAAHIIGGVFFLLFADRFFLHQHNNKLIFIIALIAAITECLQALIPYRNNHEKIHERFAYTMAFAVIIIGILAAFMIPMSDILTLICVVLALMVSSSMLFMHIVNPRFFWIIQMAATLLFYVEMFVILTGSRLR
jgi:hypothetical protein